MFNSAINNLIEQFKTLPGVGEKSAQRLAFFMVKQPEINQKKFANTLNTLAENIFYCHMCQNFSNGNLCDICANEKRNKKQICIVETPFDVIAIEKTNIYDGAYYILHGVLSPIHNIGPNDLKINELITSLENNETEEIIFALPSSIEGETTTNYIRKLLPENITTTHIARGLPSGASLEYTDEITLSHALRERRPDQ